jgi:hypothetical protein
VNDIDMYMPQGGVNGHAGQATMVEASRAMEQVRAQVVLARQFPRNIPAALAQIRETFSVPAMADRAFYSYRKGGSNVTGSTIHLAKAVAQAWGNIVADLDEMDRTPSQSTIKAWAWDLQSNTSASTTFIVPHAIDVKDGTKELTSLRDIYEVNANMGNRRLRSMLESVIPTYVMDLAKDVASATLRGGGDVPLPVRIDKAVQAFAALGVEAEQVEQERGRERGKWTEIDLAHLRVLVASIKNGEVSVAEVFPPRQLSVEDVRPAVRVRRNTPSEPPKAAAVEDVPLPEDDAPHLWSEEDIHRHFPGAVKAGPELIVPRGSAPSADPWPDSYDEPVEQPAEPAPWPAVAPIGGAE